MTNDSCKKLGVLSTRKVIVCSQLPAWPGLMASCRCCFRCCCFQDLDNWHLLHMPESTLCEWETRVHYGTLMPKWSCYSCRSWCCIWLQCIRAVGYSVTICHGTFHLPSHCFKSFSWTTLRRPYRFDSLCSLSVMRRIPCPWRFPTAPYYTVSYLSWTKPRSKLCNDTSHVDARLHISIGGNMKCLNFCSQHVLFKQTLVWSHYLTQIYFFSTWRISAQRPGPKKLVHGQWSCVRHSANCLGLSWDASYHVLITFPGNSRGTKK